MNHVSIIAALNNLLDHSVGERTGLAVVAGDLSIQGFAIASRKVRLRLAATVL